MNFFILQNGQQVGPYTEEQVRQLLSDGQVQPGDLAWREGLADWVPLSSILPGNEPAKAVPASPRTPAASAAARESEEEEEVESASNTARKLWIVLGALVVVGLFVLGGLVAYFVSQGSTADATSKAYVDDYVSNIAPKWSSDDFIARVAPPYRDQFSHAKVQELFEKLSGFGNLKSYEGSTGGAHVSLRSLGRNATAQYSAHATFEHGELTIVLTLVRIDGAWTIGGLEIVPPKHRNP